MTVKVKNLQPFHSAILGGWNNAASDLNQTSVLQQITQLQDSEQFYYFTANNGGAANNTFRWADKATPTIWTAPAFPIATDLSVCLVYPSDTDSVFIGNNSATNARVYRYRKSLNTYTNQNFPAQATHDGIRALLANPEDPDYIFVGTLAAAGSGGARLYKLVPSTLAWTQIFEFGTNGLRNVSNISYYGGRLYVGFSGGTVNIARVMMSSGSPFTIWGQIAGDTVNGSWATGTYRTCNPFVLNGILYASLSGATAGDAEVWRSSDLLGSSWTKIGGDGVNGSWAAGTKTFTSRLVGRGNLLIVGTGGGAGDGEVWQWNNSTSVWTKVAGDSVNGTWVTRNFSATQLVDREGRLLVGAGNAAVNTSSLFRLPGGFSSPANQGSGYGQIAIRL